MIRLTNPITLKSPQEWPPGRGKEKNEIMTGMRPTPSTRAVPCSPQPQETGTSNLLERCCVVRGDHTNFRSCYSQSGILNMLSFARGRGWRIIMSATDSIDKKRRYLHYFGENVVLRVPVQGIKVSR